VEAGTVTGRIIIIIIIICYDLRRVCARSVAEVVGSNPAGGCMSLVSVCCQIEVSAPG
jgi:hypothetical protein